MNDSDALAKKIALELYRLEHIDNLTTEEAEMLMGCKRKTLYNRHIPHNKCGWSKKAILEFMAR